MASIIKYIDPDVVDGLGDGSTWANAFPSWKLWNDTAYDLQAANDTMTTYHRSSGTLDSTGFRIEGWNTGINNRIYCYAETGHEAIKTGIDSARYTFSGNVQPRERYVTISGLQGNNPASSLGSVTIVGIDPGGSAILVENCYFKATTDGGAKPLIIADPDSTVTVENCILVGGTFGLQHSGGTSKMYNCTIEGSSSRGIYNTAGTLTVKNTAVFNHVLDLQDAGGTTTADYCASDLGFGSNPVAASGGDFTNEFPDYATGDYTLIETGNLFDSGVGPTVDSDVPTLDIEGDVRAGATVSIGADEFPLPSDFTYLTDGTLDVQGDVQGNLGLTYLTNGAVNIEGISLTEEGNFYVYSISGEVIFNGITSAQARALITQIVEFLEDDDSSRFYFDDIFNYAEEFSEYKR